MARRGAVDTTGSFELFLDTACNAFGGIIFISLLVCVLIQLSGAIARPDDPKEAERLQQELDRLVQEIAQLERVREVQVKQIGTIQAAHDPALHEKHARLADEKRGKEKDKREKEAQNDGVRIDVAKMGAVLRALQKDEKDARDSESSLQAALSAMPPSPPTSGAPPKVQQTKERPVEVLVSGRRLVFAKRYGSAGNPLGFNDQDPSITRTAQGMQVLPAPGRGLEITTAPLLQTALAGLLARFPNRASGRPEEERHFFKIFVWPDSCAECETLVDLLVSQQFGYTLILQEAGEPVGVTTAAHPENVLR